MWLHAHVGFWTLALILFVISLFLKGTGQKVLHMIIRLLYVLIVITGLYLVIHLYAVHGFLLIIKMIGGLGVISMMEMILVRRQKEKSTRVFWVLLIVFLVWVFYMGYGVLS